jgi:hypothetical protein
MQFILAEHLLIKQIEAEVEAEVQVERLFNYNEPALVNSF